MPVKITQGEDKNYFERVTVNSGAFPTDAQVMFNIRGRISFSMVHEGAQPVQYSFNGTTVHGDLTPSSDTSMLTFTDRSVSKIWFRTGTPGQVIRVEGWESV
jgi:hypothetical protein